MENHIIGSLRKTSRKAVSKLELCPQNSPTALNNFNCLQSDVIKDINQIILESKQIASI